MTAAFGRITANILIEIAAVHFRPDDPFILTSGRASPVYIDCRKVISFPRARRRIIEMMAETVEQAIGFESLDAVAGGETAGIPYAAWLAERLSLPMLYVRKKPKGFGRDAQIEGAMAPGCRCLLVEDLATDGGSKLNFIEAIRKAEGKVADALVVFHYGIFPQSTASLAAVGVRLPRARHLVGRAGGGRRTRQPGRGGHRRPCAPSSTIPRAGRQAMAERPRSRTHDHPSRHPFRRVGHAALAAVPRRLSQAAHAAGLGPEPAAGDGGARGRPDGLRPADPGLQRRAPVPGGRAAARPRAQGRGHPSGAPGPQHRAGGRRRRLAGGARGADPGAALGPLHRQEGKVPGRGGEGGRRRRRWASSSPSASSPRDRRRATAISARAQPLPVHPAATQSPPSSKSRTSPPPNAISPRANISGTAACSSSAPTGCWTSSAGSSRPW